MSQDFCPICGRPDGAGHEPKCLEEPASPVGDTKSLYAMELAMAVPPMAVEVCIHGNIITNKMGIACPEGCLSNAQRGLENRKLAGYLSDANADADRCWRAMNRCWCDSELGDRGDVTQAHTLHTERVSNSDQEAGKAWTHELETKLKEAICDLIDRECFDSFICNTLREEIMNLEFKPLEGES